MDRREFIKNLTALGVALGGAQFFGSVPPTWGREQAVPYRTLGSSKEQI